MYNMCIFIYTWYMYNNVFIYKHVYIDTYIHIYYTCIICVYYIYMVYV